MAVEILRMENICKDYGNQTEALRNACITIKKGEIHGLMGKNGSGKSTIVEIASGTMQPTSGQIIFNDTRVNIRSVSAARSLGISVVHQLHSVVNQLDVTQNIFLGNERTMKGGILCSNEMYQRARSLLDKVGLNVDEHARMEKLSLAQRQIVLMARAMNQNPRLLILDETTAALTDHEFEMIKNALVRMKYDGISVLLVSHKIDEIIAAADRVTVLYEGVTMGTYDADRCTAEFLVTAMTNGAPQKCTKAYEEKCTRKEIILEADNIAARYGVNGVSLTLRKGEVLGIAGIVGSGRSTLLKLLYGSMERISGDLIVCGKMTERGISAGRGNNCIGLMPGECLSNGMFNEMDVSFNIAIAALDKCTHGGFLNSKKVNNLAGYYIDKLNIKLADGTKVKDLSGGNKQRVILARYMAYKPEILLLDEPMKGIDETEREKILKFIYEMCRKGSGVIVTSDSPAELADICDRVAVMRNGKIVSEFNKEQASEVTILDAMTR